MLSCPDMLYFFDTEFLEQAPGNGHISTKLISIGIACDDGRTLYLENKDFDWDQPMPDRWLAENVKPHLVGPGEDSWQSVEEMRESILDFVDADPQFWAYVGSSDWQCLISIFGRLIDRPNHFPMFYRELKELIIQTGADKKNFPTQIGQEHNALEDAIWNMDLYSHLLSLR